MAQLEIEKLAVHCYQAKIAEGKSPATTQAYDYTIVAFTRYLTQ